VLRPTPSLSIQPFSSKRLTTTGPEESSRTLTQPRPRSRCISWRSLCFGVVATFVPRLPAFSSALRSSALPRCCLWKHVRARRAMRSGSHVAPRANGCQRFHPGSRSRAKDDKRNHGRYFRYPAFCFSKICEWSPRVPSFSKKAGGRYAADLPRTTPTSQLGSVGS
jgi:hypothetical protein